MPKEISVGTLINCNGLKQNEAQSARAESTHKGVNKRSKDVTQTQQQRRESPQGHVLLVEFMSLVFTCMSDEITVADAGLCCCVCVTSFER